MNHEEFWNSTLRQVDERLKAYLKLKQNETEEKYTHSAWFLSYLYNMKKDKRQKSLTADDFFDVEAYRKSSTERLTKAKQGRGKRVPRAEQQRTLAELKQSLEG